MGRILKGSTSCQPVREIIPILLESYTGNSALVYFWWWYGIDLYSTTTDPSLYTNQENIGQKQTTIRKTLFSWNNCSRILYSRQKGKMYKYIEHPFLVAKLGFHSVCCLCCLWGSRRSRWSIQLEYSSCVRKDG